MAKVKFTAGRVEAFTCESDKRPSFLWDSVAPGLGLRATPNGSKSYIFQAKLRGQVIRTTIGAPAAWTIAEAQAEAIRLRVLINRGQDPREVEADRLAAEQAERKAKAAAEAAAQAEQVILDQQKAIEAAQQSLLARTAWDAYLAAPHPRWGAQHRADHVIAASEGGIKTKIGEGTTKAAPLASLLRRPLYAITAPVVQEWLVSECAARPTFAHNSFRKFRTFIRWCAKQPQFQAVTHVDCCLTDEVKDIVPVSKTKDGDSLQREQLPAWFDAVRAIRNPVISAYLQGLLITGARREELARLRWDDVDFQWRSLTIHDKVEGLRVIPLTLYFLSLLAALPRRNQWVFSSPTAADGKLAEPRIAHTKALAAAGLPHVSLHGLRRSFGTLCEWVEMPSGISAQIMGHKPSALAEKHYRRRPLDLLRKWHDLIETWILEQAGIDYVPATPGLRVVSGP
ncbi:integrase family protein [Massilia sp. Leaf139]|uniref:tyrosine-type recombinase/integrase n=1 Tax=Massilia sp. Leaf139 TaxID=1736272 RepID=UPI0006FD2A75|nr:integrase family protein [Massilia sp. Leaf139]KQQ87010.1 preprotein translocase [Massilia sp. Leaf139]